MMHPAETSASEVYVSTFSVLAHDPVAKEWGMAIASRFLAVGALARFGAWDGGIVVVQANMNADNGHRALGLLRDGASAEDALTTVLDGDFNRSRRQMAAIDLEGRIAAFTGEECNGWAGSAYGANCVALGNTLAGEQVCRAMVDTMTAGNGPLARRLVDAIAAGDEAGGDVRGRQAAALLVVRRPTVPPVDVFSNPTIDLRVDDAPDPFRELSRLLDLHELIHTPTALAERVYFDKHVVRRLQRILQRLGFYDGDLHGVLDEATQAGLDTLSRSHNLRNRITSTEWLDRRVLQFYEAKVDEGA